MNNNNNNNIVVNTRNGNSTSQACAACKYQRRKCAPDCMLAPYFPHDRQRQFSNAHKLFGVANISKIIKCMDPHDKDQAMRTIIFQSDMRASDPVGGCYRYIQELQTQIEYCRAELEFVLQQVAIFRAQHQQQFHLSHVEEVMHSDPSSLYSSVSPVSSVSGTLNNYSDTPSNYHYLQQVQNQDQYVMVHEGNENSGNSNGNLQEQINAWAMQNSVSLQSLSLQGQNSSASDEYDHKPMLDMHSDERSDLAFDSQDLLHRNSDEAVLFKIDDAVIKAEADCMQQAQDHDLKGAATLFTLTNCTS